MTDRERQGWIIVGAIFMTMFFIWGAINSTPVFFLPVVTHFGWTRARLSVALSIGWITGGATGPLIGWIADRVDPKRMMIAGAAVTGLAWLALSRANSFAEFLAINGVFGICVGASTFIPASLVIASWFEHQRGLAMGIGYSGSTLGGAAMTIIANRAIAAAGWRAGYMILGLPIVFVVVPLILLFVRSRTRTPGEIQASSRPDGTAVELPGLELRQAMKTRSFWLICAAQLMGGLAIGMAPHFVAYLAGIGYTATAAARVVSLFLILTTAGTLLGGPFADRFSARLAMSATYILSSLGMLSLMLAAHPFALATNVLAGGFAGGALIVQMPLIIIESLGVRRLGSVLGISGIFYTFGAAVSPIAIGRIFDLTGSYSIAISSLMAMLIVCSFAMLATRPLGREQAQLTAPARSIAV
jgi:MFS family permease